MAGTPPSSREAGGPTGASTSDTAGANTAASSGTTLADPAGANVKGAWTELDAVATGADAVLVAAQPQDVGRADFLLDIGVGGAGSEVAIVSNLLFTSEGGAAPPYYYFLPLAITAGQRVAGRYQVTTTTSTGLNVIVYELLGGAVKALQAATARTYGADTSDSGGTVVDPGAVANTKGAWTEISASLTAAFTSCLVILGNRVNPAPTAQNVMFDVGLGGAGSEVAIVSDVYVRRTAQLVINPASIWLPVGASAGQRLAIRMQSSTMDATDRLCDFVVVGFGS